MLDGITDQEKQKTTMGKKKEPWIRVGVTLPSRLIQYLDRFPIDRSAALALCVQYAASTDFIRAFAGALPEDYFTNIQEVEEAPDAFACLDDE